MLRSVNPTHNKIIKDYPEMTPQQWREILQSTHQAFLPWKNTAVAARRIPMEKLAQILEDEDNKLTWARLMADEMGRPIKSGISEIEKCAWTARYFAENAEAFLRDELIPAASAKNYVCFNPLGVILGVMPWNFPFWQVLRFAIPALMAGNGVVLKHASNVSGCALALEELFAKAQFPPHLFRTLLVTSSQVSPLIHHPLIKAVSLTGSVEAGRAVAAVAGAALKKTVLELGGSDPFIVLQDADVEKAASAAIASRMINGGQSCIAAKRFIVVKQVQEEFENLCLEKMAFYQQNMGNPLSSTTELGPLSSLAACENLHRQVKESIQKGARCLLGGKWPIPEGPCFYPPTLLTAVKAGMPAYHQELFGPVAAIIAVENEAQAIEVANDTNFGLGATIFTEDRQRGEYLAKNSLEAGVCCVNEMVKSDPRLPFGGIKDSGLGRELSSFGIREFVNIKTVCLS